MTIEVNLVGMRCGAEHGGLSCAYCYQGAVRERSENATPGEVDHPAVQRAVRAARPRKGDGFSTFGGEPLLASLDDLEKLWRFGLDEYDSNGVQTSGRPITDAHFDLFKRYKVHVGFSIDGPGDLNRPRMVGLNGRVETDRIEEKIERCLDEGIGCSIICTLHRFNAVEPRLMILKDWFRMWASKGMKSSRLHTLELDGPTKYLALSHDENENALWDMYLLESEIANVRAQSPPSDREPFRFDVFKDIEKLLLGEDESVTCVWNQCDPLSTPAVHGIGADGERYMCERVNKDGYDWTPSAQDEPLIRTLVLWETAQEDGGCQGCRYFAQCKGQCPGTAFEGDWRKRSRDCILWYRLFERIEAKLKAEGKTTYAGRRDIVDKIIAGAATGVRMPIKAARDPWTVPVPGGFHGDHTDGGAR